MTRKGEPRYMRFTDRGVVGEAKARLEVTYDLHDSVVVLFSGGKDSLVCLDLCRQVHEERNLGPVQAVFWDMEFFMKPLLDFVEQLREEEWIELKWVCLPLARQTLNVGRIIPVTFWEPEREWVRQPPSFAEQPAAGALWTHEDRDRWLADQYPGNTAAVTGARASESLIRLRAVIQKRIFNWQSAPLKGSGLVTSKPIYDWLEDDVYRYIWETERLELPPVYQWLLATNQGLRTSTVTHRGAAKYLDRLAQIDPNLYDRICEVLPEMKLQALYWSELDMEAIQRKYGRSYAGVRRWIDEHITDLDLHATAIKTYDQAMTAALITPEAYAPHLMLSHFVFGSIDACVQPTSTRKRRKEILYE